MEPKTLTITEFGGPLTRRNNGDINSGLAKFDTSWGYDPYSEPGNLTWLEQPVSILSLTPSNSSVATIYNMKFRDEGGISRVYAIGGLSTAPSLYRIQVANNSTPNLDSPSIIGAFTGGLTYPSGMVFFGSTEKIFFGSNDAIERRNFDGSSPSTLSSGDSNFLTNVPRPMATFLGKIYFGNFNNIGEIDSTETITTSIKLSPALPSGLYVTDLDVTPDGNYIQITATRTIPQIVSGTGSTFPSRSTTDSYKFLWNGTDPGITAFIQFNGVTFFASEVFGDKNYAMGRDIHGAMIVDSNNKISFPEAKEGINTATYSIGDTFGVALPEFEKSASRYRTALFHYGTWDNESRKGLYRLLRHPAQTFHDVKFVPCVIPVTSQGYTPTVASFVGQLSSVGKLYYSTSEVHASIISSMAHALWRFPVIKTGLGSIVAGVYETQTQLFSKKMKVGEVRVYTNPLTTDNAFEVDLIGSGGSVLSGGSYRFVVGTSSVATGTDMVQYNPATAPTYALGVRVTNASVTGTRNWSASKIEIDVAPAGK